MNRQTPDISAESGAVVMRAVQRELLEVLDG